MKTDIAVMLAALFLFGLVASSGCAGPSKARLRVLLEECRVQNREAHRVIHEYEKLKCESHPEQLHGALQWGEAGY